MTPRVITGIGIVSAFGTGKEAFFRAMRDGESALAAAAPSPPIASFDASRYGANLPLVEVPGFDPTKTLGDKGLRVLDRLTKLLLVAARLALSDAGYKREGAWTHLSPERVGVCCSNAYGSLEAITELDRVAKLEDARYINPAKFPNTVSNSASGYVSIWEDLRALNVSVSDGNCGALDAFACADLFLAARRADAILTGGGEAMSEALFLAFQKLGALRKTRLGEGAAFLALETLPGARARGASELGHVTGYGTAFVAPEDETSLVFASREAAARAIEAALADANVRPGDIDVVASSVSGIERVDVEELAGIERVLGDVAVAAPKRALGETLGAGGAMGVAAGLAWLSGAPVASLVRGRAPTKVEHVLVTAIGYYGNASAVVVRAPRA
jgi:3-oxoacyl-[acyl-carrier-protein] synthase II